MHISVLVVDDNPQTIRTAQADFTEMGFSVLPADNGLEAVEYLRTDPSACQIVFMNLRMPVMDGFTATRLIRSELRLDLLPIIGVGQHNSGEERDLALAAGMNDWMPKSRCKEEILTLLLRHLPGTTAMLMVVGTALTTTLSVASLVYRYLPPGADTNSANDMNREIRRRLIESGEFYVSQTTIGGVAYLRMTVINPLTTIETIDQLINKIRQIGQAVSVPAAYWPNGKGLC